AHLVYWPMRSEEAVVPGNGKVFISFAPEDAERCAALRVALDAWSVDHWFTNGRLTADRHVSRRTMKVIGERDIFIRVCTPAALRQDTTAHLTQPLVAHSIKREAPGQIRRSGRLLGGDPSQPTTIYLEAWMPLPALDPEPAANGGARIRTIASLVTLQGRVH